MNNAYDFEKATEQMAAFQKMWLDSWSKMIQATSTFSPNSPPPELLRQMRGGMFQALSEAWEEFMRSPTFLEGTRQWMDNVTTWRKASNDFLAKTRNELQAPSREDIDNVMRSVRHLEQRLLDRMDELADKLNELNRRLEEGQSKRPATRSGSTKTEVL